MPEDISSRFKIVPRVCSVKKYCENIWINPSPHNLRSMQAEPLATHIWLAGSKTTKSFFVLLPTITKNLGKIIWQDYQYKRKQPPI